MTALRVVIDARLARGLSGGLEAVVIGLAEALSELDDAEEYLFLGMPDSAEWLAPHLRGRARIIQDSAGRRRRGPRALAGAMRTRLSAIRASGDTWPPRGGPYWSDGLAEQAGANVVHLVRQHGFLTRIPTIYHPHDLQHRHLPDLFTPEERQYRDRWYGKLCAAASMVAVTSSWTRNDVVRELNVAADKVKVVPWAPPLRVVADPSAAQIEAVRAARGLPERFVLYPARTWPHKNHITLLRAIAALRNAHGIDVPVVFTGQRTDYAAAIDAVTAELGLGSGVLWLGFLGEPELAAVFRLATAVVIPSRFEAASGPLWEAFAFGVPAACSNVTSLPAQAGNAALVFDPDDIDAIADAIARLWRSPDLRHTLIEKGRIRVAGFTWERTARLFRAHYRRLGRAALTEEDRHLLAAAPTL